MAWALWDWGTQPWSSVVTTFVFSVYLVGAAFGSANRTAAVQSICMTIAGVVVALTAPVLGQSADRSGRTMRNLRWLTWILAILTATLFFVRPQPQYLWLGFGLLGLGTIVSEIAAVNYNAELHRVAGARNIGTISGFGWGMGYLGGIVALLLLFFAFIAPQRGLFGVTSADGMNVRVAMLVCALWTVVFTIPIFRALKDPPGVAPGARIGVLASYRRLGATLAQLWRTDRPLVYFLVSSALFRDGLNGVFAFGGVLATNTFGFSSSEVIVFGAAANIVAGLATIASGLADDRLGPKPVIVGSLVGLLVTGSAIFAFHGAGKGFFWVFGLVLCVFVGPAQSASRSYLARLVPEERSGEMFGLYATTGRVASPLSPFLFGVFVGLGALVTGQSNTQYWGIIGILIVLLAGLVTMIPITPTRRSATASTQTAV